MNQKDQDEDGIMDWVFGDEQSECNEENLTTSSQNNNQYDKHSDSEEEYDNELCNDNDEDSKETNKDRDICEYPKSNKIDKQSKHKRYYRGPLTKNPFFNFLREFRHKTCGTGAVEIAIEGAKQWNEMTAEEKAKYKVKEIRKAHNSKTRTKTNGSGARKSKDKC